MPRSELQLVFANHGTDPGIRRSRLDGSRIKNVITGESNAQPGLFYDPSRSQRKLYWTEVGNGYIRRANVRGHNKKIEPLFSMVDIWGWGGHTQVVPWGLALSISTGKMFWTAEAGNSIYRANIEIPVGETYQNRTDAEIIVSGLNRPVSLGIDTVNDQLYFIERGPYGQSNINDKISRCDFNGLGIEVLVSGSMVVPGGISLDVGNDWMYWCDWGLGTVNKAHLDGTGRITIVSGLTEPTDTALDLENEKIYWVEYRAVPDGNIQRANFDGSSVEVVVSGMSRSVSALIADIGRVSGGVAEKLQRKRNF